MELLSSSDTRVRCGECLSIFDALANLRNKEGDDDDYDPLIDATGNIIDSGTGAKGGFRGASNLPDASAAALAGLAYEDSDFDATYTDFDLFSAEAGLPDIEYLDEVREVQPYDIEDLAEGGLDDTLSADMFSSDLEPAVEAARSALAQEGEAARILSSAQGLDEADSNDSFRSTEKEVNRAARANLSPARQAADRASGVVLGAKPPADDMDELLLSLKESQPEPVPEVVEEESVGSWWFRSLLFLLVLSLAAALYGYRERESLQHNKVLRPILQSVCSVFGCRLAEQVDLSSLQVLKRSVFSHPNAKNVLIINVVFVNAAEFSQPYPVLEIRLTDRNGRLVVMNEFEPAKYLDNWQRDRLLGVDETLDLRLNIEDPGNEAMSFELDFREVPD